MIDMEKKAGLKQKDELLNGDFQRGLIKSLGFLGPRLKIKI